MKLTKIFLTLGMISFLIYFIYTIIGAALWSEYNWITTDISTLSAVGSPNQKILKPLLFIYGLLLTLFILTLLIHSIKSKYNTELKAGFILILLMITISNIGYTLFPLSGDKTVMSFQNLMHLLTTGLVVLLSIFGLLLIAKGYIKESITRKFGFFILSGAILFTILGALNPVCINLEINILGLTERLAIFTLHLILGIIGLEEIKHLNQQN